MAERATKTREQVHRDRMRLLNRAILAGCAVFLPVYIGLRLTGGSAARLEQLPDLLSRIKTPIVCSVPEGGVQYLRFFHGEASEGHRFVLVRVHMEARMKIGYPVVPRCFRLLDDEENLYYPLSHSPLFIHRTDRFSLDRDDQIDDELVFEVPDDREAERLLFERYQE